MKAAKTSTPSNYFPLFDSLRAIAAIAVLISHVAYYSGVSEVDTFLRPLTSRMEVGVTIFFLISGFLLYRPFAQARFESSARPRTLAYAWRRFLRIAPAYWFVITLVLFIDPPPANFNAFDVSSFYTFTMAYDLKTVIEWEGLAQAWTLCQEVVFYAFLPIFAWLMSKFPAKSPRHWLKTELAVIGGIGVASYLYKVIALQLWSFDTLRNSVWDLIFPYYLDQFALGMGLAVVSIWVVHTGKLPKILKPIDRFPSIAWGVAVAAFLVAALAIEPPLKDGLEMFSNGQWLAQKTLYEVLAFFILLPAVFGNQSRGLVRKFLGLPTVVYLGMISYSIYLLHLPLLDKVWRVLYDKDLLIRLPDNTVVYFLIWCAIGLAGAIFLATLCYFAVEKPVLKLKRLVPDWSRINRRKATTPPATARASKPVKETV